MFIKQHRDDYSYYFDLEKEEKHTVGRAGKRRGDCLNDSKKRKFVFGVDFLF